MSVEDDIAAQLAELEREEEENLSRYMEEHPEEFSHIWVPTKERWRNAQQARARARQKAKAYIRTKQRQELDACILGLDLSLGDGRIRRVKVYKMQVGKNKKD